MKLLREERMNVWGIQTINREIGEVDRAESEWDTRENSSFSIGSSPGMTCVSRLANASHQSLLVRRAIASAPDANPKTAVPMTILTFENISLGVSARKKTVPLRALSFRLRSIPISVPLNIPCFYSAEGSTAPLLFDAILTNDRTNFTLLRGDQKSMIN